MNAAFNNNKGQGNVVTIKLSADVANFVPCQ